MDAETRDPAAGVEAPEHEGQEGGGRAREEASQREDRVPRQGCHHFFGASFFVVLSLGLRRLLHLQNP